MAFIISFEKEDKNFRKQEPAETTYSIKVIEDEKIFQLNMYGSTTRQDKGKVSQVIQINKEGAIELIKLLQNTFML